MEKMSHVTGEYDVVEFPVLELLYFHKPIRPVVVTHMEDVKFDIDKVSDSHHVRCLCQENCHDLPVIPTLGVLFSFISFGCLLSKRIPRSSSQCLSQLECYKYSRRTYTNCHRFSEIPPSNPSAVKMDTKTGNNTCELPLVSEA